MNRRNNDEFLAQQLAPISQPQEGGLEDRRLIHRSSRTAMNARLRGLKKWHSVPSPSSCGFSAKGPVSTNATNEVGIMPLIGEDEDFAHTAVSRWQSLPCLDPEEVDEKVPPQSTVQKKRIGRPKPPRRQKSMESMGEKSN